MPSTRVCHIKQPGPAPPTASCYICLENSESNNQPLLRNCACRGDAGWAHIACLAEFAANKVTEFEAQWKKDPSIKQCIASSFWEICILCKTLHMQYMGLAMAEAFVKQYEHLPDSNPLRFYSLFSLASNRLYVGDYDDALGMFVCLQEMNGFLTSTGIDVRKQEGHVLGMMGAVFFEKQQFSDALSTFEQQRELYVTLFRPNSPEVKENNEMIVTMKECIKNGGYGHPKEDTAAELVTARERFRENLECVDIRERLLIHMRLVQALSNDGRHQEAKEQFEKIIVESRQSLGPNHPDTLTFENDTERYRHLAASNSSAAGAATSQKKDVWAVIDCEQQPAISGQRVQVLRATKDGQKYICLIKNGKGVSSKVKVAQNQFILETGTPIVVHGLVSSTNLNGSIGIIRSFDKEKRRYAISVRKKKTTVWIKPINLNVVFN